MKGHNYYNICKKCGKTHIPSKLGYKTSIKSKKLMSKSQRKNVSRKDYVNPMKGKKRPDLSEYNRKYKSEQIKGDKNPNKRPEVIAKRKRTTKGRTKEIYGKKGSKNPNWKGGIAYEPYTFEFNKELKLAIKIRDNFKCKLCGIHNDKTKQGLHIHHIDYNKKNCSLNNLVALCGRCNAKCNSKRQRWILYFSRQFNIEKEYVSWEQIELACIKIYKFLKNKRIDGLVPIIRGGALPAVILSYKLNKPIKEKVENKYDVIIDEIVDFGMVFKSYKKKYPDNLFVCVHLNKNNFKLKQKPDFYVSEVDKYIVYPWELKSKNG